MVISLINNKIKLTKINLKTARAKRGIVTAKQLSNEVAKLICQKLRNG